MLSLFSVALTAFYSSLLIKSTVASPCVVFDSNFNLYAFGFGGKDFTLGAQSSWTSGSATDITANGRPPFDGTNTTCYLAQFFNAIYVLNGDSSNPTNIGVYDVAGKSWTNQQTSLGSTGTGGSFDYSNFVAILDHDTNVFYALSGSNFWDLDFSKLTTTANTSEIPWNFVGTPSFSTSGYQPVMALAQNHIHFLNVPGAQPGTAQIFVIHFSFFQPAAQTFTTNGSSTPFPETHGQTASFFQPSTVQQEFAFIPDDNSQTYVINVESNTTAILPGPSDKTSSTFTAGLTSLIQLTSEGKIFFFPYTQDTPSVNNAANWTEITVSGLPSPSASASGSGSSSPTGSKTGSGSSPTVTSSSSSSGSSGTGSAAKVYGASIVRTIGVVGLFAAIGYLL